VEDGRLLRAISKGGKVKKSLSDWAVVEQCAKQIGIDGSGRTTCAHLCRKNGGDLERIKFLLGHTGLGAEFPGVEGFSLRNLRYMRSFVEAWPDPQILQLVAKLPWGYHMVLLDRLKDGQSREWNLRAFIEYGWSRNVLTHHISTQLREREGKALTNFSRTLPTEDSDLTQQILKDPYSFEFLTLSSTAKERELERGLLKHLRDLLLGWGAVSPSSAVRCRSRSQARPSTSISFSIIFGCTVIS
jgi:predicted nuclease of restriction endonuclease-like (RecB) superfamily